MLEFKVAPAENMTPFLKDGNLKKIILWGRDNIIWNLKGKQKTNKKCGQPQEIPWWG